MARMSLAELTIAVGMIEAYTSGKAGPNGYTSCPDSWTPYGSWCFFFGFDQLMPFTAAQHFCIQRGANLVHIAGGHEWNFLRNFLHSFHPSTWWIGLNDQETEGEYKWIGLEDTTKPFTDWDNGSPTLANATTDTDCVFLHPTNFFMSSVGCNVYFQPICKKMGSHQQQVVG